MARYITVLNSDLNKTYWEAIQWDNSLSSIRKNRYYTAGVNMNLPKSSDDNRLEEKIVIETSTHKQGTATVISLGISSINSVKLANNKASKSFLKTVES